MTVIYGCRGLIVTDVRDYRGDVANRVAKCDPQSICNPLKNYPILPRFRDIAGFLLTTTPPLFRPNFRGVPIGLDCQCVASRSEDPKLFRTSPTYILGLGPVRYMTIDHFGTRGGRLRYSPVSVHELLAELACTTSVQKDGLFQYT